MSYPARGRPHPNPPPSSMGEGMYTPSPGCAGGGSGWGESRDVNTRKLNRLHAPIRSRMS
jgi:hypothetical protein